MGAALIRVDRHEEANSRFSRLSDRVFFLRARSRCCFLFYLTRKGKIFWSQRKLFYIQYLFCPHCAARDGWTAPPPATSLLVVHKPVYIHSPIQPNGIDTVTGLQYHAYLRRKYVRNTGEKNRPARCLLAHHWILFLIECILHTRDPRMSVHVYRAAAYVSRVWEVVRSKRAVC